MRRHGATGAVGRTTGARVSGGDRPGSSTRPPSLFVRVMGALVWLYPPRFRQRYGKEWGEVVDTLATEPRYIDAAGRARLARHLLFDVVRSAAREWGEALAATVATVA